MSSNSAGSRLGLGWLIRLRWGAIAGQALTIGIVQWAMDIALPLTELGIVLGVETAANLWVFPRLAARAGRDADRLAAAGIAFDVLALTALLYLTGGPFNPFNFLYLVYIALAVVVVGARTTWALLALSVLAFGGLFFDHRHLHALHDHHDAIGLHVQGMWYAYIVASVFIVYFISRVRLALERREAELRLAQDQAHRAEKMASLATLAAGAAHELSTPLATIGLVASEMAPAATGAVAEDVTLIRAEVDRCRRVLDQLAADSGQTVGQQLEPASLGELVTTALAELRDGARVTERVSDATRSRVVQVPSRSFVHALRAVVMNALQAGDGEVTLTASADGEGATIAVADRGVGMSADVLARATDPFFTSRETGEGMGLGLFLAQSVLDSVGGRLAVESTEGVGTTVTLWLP